ncbi:uncharacterized protein RCH25_018256 [Pelodytes ibericus]
MKVDMKSGVITVILALALMASVFQWRSRIQQQQEIPSIQLPVNKTWTVDGSPNTLQRAWWEDEKDSKDRNRRSVIIELGASSTDKVDTLPEKAETTIKNGPTRKKYSIIFPGKHKDTSMVAREAERQMEDIFEGSGSGFVTSESPPITVTFTTSKAPETTKPPDTTPTTTSTSTATTIATTAPITSLTTTRDPGKPTLAPVTCQNGGTYDATKCICFEDFYGPLCEFIIDRVPIAGKFVVETKVEVVVKIVNIEFSQELADNTTDTYKDFVLNFISEMNVFYKGIPSFQEVKVTSIKKGSIVVDHDVITKAVYKEDESIGAQYEKIYENVNQILDGLKENNCTVGKEKLCLDPEATQTVKIPPPTEEELCKAAIRPGFEQYFAPVVTRDGLVCASSCDPISKSYYKCNLGSCQIQNQTGPHCLCPDTDSYLYTGSRCQGRVLKAGLYGGVGAAIAVLLIIIATVVFLMIRVKKRKERDAFNTDPDDSWYNDNQSDWSAERGFTNISGGGEAGDDGEDTEACYLHSLIGTPRTTHSSPRLDSTIEQEGCSEMVVLQDMDSQYEIFSVELRVTVNHKARTCVVCLLFYETQTYTSFPSSAPVFQWQSRIQQQPEIPSIQIPVNKTWTGDGSPNTLQRAWWEEEKDSTERGRRSVVMEWESSDMDRPETLPEKVETIVKNAPTRKKYSIIFPGKLEDTSMVAWKAERIMEEIFEEKGSGFGTSESPPNAVTFTTSNAPETTKAPDTTPLPITSKTAPTTLLTTAPTTLLTTAPTPTTVPKKTEIPPLPCQNGGTYDDNKCKCFDEFYGPLCEFIVDRLPVAVVVEAKVEVEVKIVNVEFSQELADNTTDTYKDFEHNFKIEMNVLYKDISGFKGVNIKSIKKGSVLVDHDIIVEAVYKEDESITAQYEKIFQNVDKTLEALKDQNCTTGEGSELCLDPGATQTVKVPPKTEEELCKAAVIPGFEQYFAPVVTSDGLICASSCDPISKTYYNCSLGSCQIQNQKGPHCLCPDTDSYLYTGSRCQGRVLKAGLYGGVGAAIAVLLIIIATVVFLMIRLKKRKERDDFNTDPDDSWYNDNQSDWSAERGFTNISGGGEAEADELSGNDSTSRRERFQPALENVNTSIEVKIQRPVISVP